VSLPSTIFSPDRIHRYTLWRSWDGGAGFVQFIGLNPSTADEVQDDPTVRRCIGYAKAWGYAGLCMTNAFAFRSTDPTGLRTAADPIGPENDRRLVEVSRFAGKVVAAWGVHATFMGREAAVRKLIPNLFVLKLTKDGHPGHPLYLKQDLWPFLWTAPL